MTKKKTGIDEITILGPRRPSRDWPLAIHDVVAEGKTLSPEQERLIREPVATFTIATGADFRPPAWVQQGLTTSGWMSLRQPVEFASYDYTEVEAVEETPEADAALEEAVEAVEKDEEKPSPRARAAKGRRR